MIRRVAAAAVLLTFAAFMLLMPTKAASAASRPVCAMALEKEAEQRKLRGSLSDPEEADTSTRLNTAAAPVLAPRRSQLIDEPTPAGEAPDVTATVPEAETPAGAAHPRRAREAWSPASALTPDATTLQTFRC